MAYQFHVDIGPQYEGEVIRKENLYIEFGGPKVKEKFELVTLKGLGEVDHGRVELIGPDIKDLKEGGSYPLAILIDIAGEKLEKDMEPVIERRIHMYTNYIEGWYHMNQRSEIWLRMSKEAYRKGFNSLKELGEIYIFLFTSEITIIERISVTFITDRERVASLLPYALDVYRRRDERIRGLKDEDVEEFYGCVLCQSFAPTHICFITPERISNCGAISWLDGRAAYRLDPDGPVFAVPKGELLDPIRGEYSGINKVAAERSLGTFDRVYLYSAFEHPHTSCGCFQALCFYIPEVDAFGIVHRDFIGNTVIGKPFSTMAGEASGGRQVEGLCGMALELLNSPKFFQADGGLYRVVWMPKEIKERYRRVIEEKGIYDKIATEEDVSNTDQLLSWLESRKHPWIIGEVNPPI